MRYQYYTADVFTDQIFGGNQLAVFPDGRGLDPAIMQLVAREFNYSETVFVLPPVQKQNTRRLRIFTPAAELPFAGHPTVGTAFVLAVIGAIPLDGDSTTISFEEGVGPVPVTIRAAEGRPVYSQLWAARMPEIGPEPPAAAEIASLLSLNAGDLMMGEYAPQAASCGMPFLFVPLVSLDAVRRARLVRDQWEQVLGAYWAPQVFLFAFGGERAGSDFHARMFAPALGVGEDPATGSAATALAGYLAARDPRPGRTLRWVVEQGFEMGRPSILDIEADRAYVRGLPDAIRVGGKSVLVAEGTMEIPDGNGSR